MSLLDLPKHIKRRFVEKYINPKLFKKEMKYLIYENYIEIIKMIDMNDFSGSKIHRLFEDACYYGNEELMELMISKGACNWNYGLNGACRGNQKKIMEMMITKGANDLNGGFWNCCLGGNKELTDFYVAQKNDVDLLNWCMFSICFGGNREILDIAITKGANNWNWGLDGACYGNQKEMAELMISKGANHFDEALRFCRTQEMKDFILSKMNR